MDAIIHPRNHPFSQLSPLESDELLRPVVQQQRKERSERKDRVRKLREEEMARARKLKDQVRQRELAMKEKRETRTSSTMTKMRVEVADPLGPLQHQMTIKNISQCNKD